MKPKPRKRRFARAWHRWLGVIAALPLLWLAVSGVLLNHASFFGLEKKEVTSTWVLKRYGQLPEGAARGVNLGGEPDLLQVMEWDELLFFEGRLLDVNGVLTGAVSYEDGAAIATEEVVYLVSADGTVMDRLDETVLPGIPVTGVLTDENGLLVVAVGGKSFRYDEDLLEADEVELTGELGEVVTANKQQQAQLEGALASMSGIPLSRVILDLHSGKLLGWPGWLVTDLSAVCLVVLTLLGLRLFPKRKT